MPSKSKINVQQVELLKARFLLLKSNIALLCFCLWFKIICAVTSPVLAGFLLLFGSISTAGCFQRSWVWLLQVLFIQKSIRIHQILERRGTDGIERLGKSTAQFRDRQTCKAVCISYRNIQYLCGSEHVWLQYVRLYSAAQRKCVPPSRASQTVMSLYIRTQKDKILTHHIIVIYVNGWQRPHFDSVGIQSRFLCWNHRLFANVSFTELTAN